MRIRRYEALPLAPDTMPLAPLVLPWNCVVSDNDRFIVVYGQNRLSPKYRAAKQHIGQRAALHWSPRALLVGDVYLLARFYFPDLRKRDAGNYRKALTDALSGVVYADDKQIVDERYQRVALDRGNPRCEVWLSDQPIALECAA